MRLSSILLGLRSLDHDPKDSGPRYPSNKQWAAFLPGSMGQHVVPHVQAILQPYALLQHFMLHYSDTYYID
eukprot:409900-Ditylum_brightwellii.AAC.1